MGRSTAASQSETIATERRLASRSDTSRRCSLSRASFRPGRWLRVGHEATVVALSGALPPDVAPGKTWNYMVVLHPGTVGRTSNIGMKPGMFKTDWGVPMEKVAQYA